MKAHKVVECEIIERRGKVRRRVHCYCGHFLAAVAGESADIETKCRNCKRIVEIILEGDDIYIVAPNPVRKGA